MNLRRHFNAAFDDYLKEMIAGQVFYHPGVRSIYPRMAFI